LPDSPVDSGGILLAEPVVDGQAAQQHEPEAVLESIHDVVNPRPESRKGKVLSSDVGDSSQLFLRNMSEGSLEILEVLLRQVNDPPTGIAELVALPYIRSLNRIAKHLGH